MTDTLSLSQEGVSNAKKVQPQAVIPGAITPANDRAGGRWAQAQRMSQRVWLPRNQRPELDSSRPRQRCVVIRRCAAVSAAKRSRAPRVDRAAPQASPSPTRARHTCKGLRPWFAGKSEQTPAAFTRLNSCQSGRTTRPRRVQTTQSLGQRLLRLVWPHAEQTYCR